MIGLALWPLIEYGVHRGRFHMDKLILSLQQELHSCRASRLIHYARNLPDNRVCITLHFLLHGHHHYLPADEFRAVMPPTVSVAFATPMYRLVRFVFYWNEFSAMAVFCGVGFGYIATRSRTTSSTTGRKSLLIPPLLS